MARVVPYGGEHRIRGAAGNRLGNEEPPGARQIICLDIEMVQTSCGYGVPLFDYKEERPTLRRWAENKGEDGVAAYWRENNVYSIDGFETGVADNEPIYVGARGR